MSYVGEDPGSGFAARGLSMNWKRFGACRRADPALFFPDAKEGPIAAEPAKAICHNCFVRAQCLDYALSHHEFGVWGETTERERRKIQDRYIRRKALAQATGGR